MSKTSERNKLIKACIANAKNLLASARAIIEAKQSPASAYALSTLALEEIGKAGLLRAGWVEDATQVRLGSPKKLDDHVFKILFGLMGSDKRMSKSYVDDYQNLQKIAERIHQTRVGSTYAPTDNKSSLIKVRKSEAQSFIRFVDARIALEESHKIKLPTKQNIEDANWLVTMFKDEDIARFVFSKASIAKLDEFGDKLAWMKWVREEVGKRNQLAQARMEQELNRVADPQNTKEPKWLITMRLHVPLHHIDKAALDEWNKWAPDMKMRFAGTKGKQELLVDLMLPASVHVKDLWKVGFNFAQRLAIALNIGAMGFLWWQTPQHQSVYYESIQDLEDKTWQLEVSQVGDFKKMFEKLRLPLGKEQLWRAFRAFIFLPNGPEKFEAFSLYSSALNFIGRANVFWPQFYNEAFAYLYLSLKTAFKAYGELGNNEKFALVVQRKFGGSKLAQDVKLDELIEWGEMLTSDSSKLPEQKFIPLEHVMNFKILIDAYYNRIFQDALKAATDAEKKTGK